MVKTAVILAAGLGSRLKERTEEHPKGFLVLDSLPIVEESIQKLIARGIETIWIGTGYLKGHYEELEQKYPQIRTVENPKYAKSGSMETLLRFQDLITDDFLLLESDLIYEGFALDVALREAISDVVVADQVTEFGDEVYIQLKKSQFLDQFSKEFSTLETTDAVLVGITKISVETFIQMCDYYLSQPDKTVHYEDVLMAVAQTKDIFVSIMDDLTWCEIDDEYHLNRAISEVYPAIKAKETYPKVRRNILLNPGPATTTDTVKYAQVVPDICPREKAFGNLLKDIGDSLTEFVAPLSAYTTTLFGGSGTAAVESVICSVVADGKLLVVNNGAYGKRIIEIANVYGISVVEFKSSEISPVDWDQIEEILKNESSITHIACVHHETTTGLVNDISSLGRLSCKYGKIFVVDAMSSYAALPIDMVESSIDFLIASSNKNLQGMAGISFVISSKNSLDRIKDIKPKSYYLNLYLQHISFQQNLQMRFTPPVQTCYALWQAILETKREGIHNRYSRYCQNWDVLMAGLSDLGLETVVDEAFHSKLITAVKLPGGVSFDDMHAFLLSKGVTIYPGKLSELNTFRIANIGQLTSVDIKYVTGLLKIYFNDFFVKDEI